MKGLNDMSKKLLFVFNPMSGKAQIKSNLFRTVNKFSKNGFFVTVYPTQKENDAYHIIKENASEFDLVVIAGGDGTLNEGIRALMAIKSHLRPKLGYIPTGTTNDFATSLKIPKNIPKAIDNILLDQTLQCDVGLFNHKNFLYIAAFGAFTDVSYKTPQQTKNFWGHSAYILEGLKMLPALKPHHVRIEYDNTFIEDDFIFGMVSNTNSVGGFKLGKVFKAQLNDGLFEVVLIKNPRTLTEHQEIISSLLTQDLSSDSFYVFKTNKLRILSSEPIQWTLDGEFGGEYLDANICVEPSAITFLTK